MATIADAMVSGRFMGLAATGCSGWEVYIYVKPRFRLGSSFGSPRIVRRVASATVKPSCRGFEHTVFSASFAIRLGPGFERFMADSVCE